MISEEAKDLFMQLFKNTVVYQIKIQTKAAFELTKI